MIAASGEQPAPEQKRSLFALLASSRKAAHAAADPASKVTLGRTSAPGPRCARCRGVGLQASAATLRCRCGFVVHSSCAYPPLPEKVAAVAAVRGWSCDACVQVQAFQAAVASGPNGRPQCLHDDFCCVCAGCGPESALGLVPCSSCRASFHPSCAVTQVPVPCGEAVATSAQSCPSCSAVRGRLADRVSLEQWSLELVSQAGGESGQRAVPVVRGVRLSATGPPGALWQTSEIVHVMEPRTLLTRTGQIVELRGPLCQQLADRLHLPRQLAQSFQAGFPQHAWLALLRYVSQPPPPAIIAALEACNHGQPQQARRPVAVRHHARRTKAGTAPPQKAGWTAADVAALRQALREIRPSQANYWQLVAQQVGRPTEECQRQAFGADAPAAPSGPGKRRATRGNVRDKENVAPPEEELAGAPQKDGPRRAKRVRAFLNARSFGSGRDFLQLEPNLADDEPAAASAAVPPPAAPPVAAANAESADVEKLAADVANSETSPPTAPTTTASAREAEASTTAGNFSAEVAVAEHAVTNNNNNNNNSNNNNNNTSNTDNIQTHGLQTNERTNTSNTDNQSEAAPVAAATLPVGRPGLPDAPSPGSLLFLSSLHTGLTPEGPAAQRWQMDSSPGLADCFGGRRRLQFGEEEELDEAEDVLGLGDSSWEPKGLDGFICEARARRGRFLAARGRGEMAPGSPLRPVRTKELAARQEMHRAPALLRRVDGRDFARAALDTTPKSEASETSEDEMAPIANIPVLSSPGNTRDQLIGLQARLFQECEQEDDTM